MEVATIISITVACLTIVTFILTRGKESGAINADMQYIKRRVDDILLENKDTNRRIDNICERLVAVEESAKSAHKRIDEIKTKPAAKTAKE